MDIADQHDNTISMSDATRANKDVASPLPGDDVDNCTALPLSRFLDDLGHCNTSPSSGSVAALLGAIAAMQARMAVSCALRRGRNSPDADQLDYADVALAASRRAFEQLMTADIATCRQYVEAIRSHDKESIRVAALQATEVPAQIIRRAVELADTILRLQPLISPRLVPELRVAATSCEAGIRSARVLIEANLETAGVLPESGNQFAETRQAADRTVQLLEQLINLES